MDRNLSNWRVRGGQKEKGTEERNGVDSGQSIWGTPDVGREGKDEEMEDEKK